MELVRNRKRDRKVGRGGRKWGDEKRKGMDSKRKKEEWLKVLHVGFGVGCVCVGFCVALMGGSHGT